MDLLRITRIANRAADEHGAHTVVLYGSWARGDATPESDVDLLLVRDAGQTLRDSRELDGVHLDAFVYPASVVATPDVSFLRILGGRVLRESSGSGQALLDRVAELDRRGPPPLPPGERSALLFWSRRTIDRIRNRPGPEGDYRRVVLLMQALEDYFALRATWFRGSKEAIDWLRRHDPAVFAAFATAMRRDSTDDDVAAFVEKVYVEGQGVEEPGS